MQEFINKLKNAVQGELPGTEAQYLMAPVHRNRIAINSEQAKKYTQSAVMILFCLDENNELFIPLIERMPYKGIHGGQISLPGGKFESADANLEHTALRECFEEIGLNEIEVLGSLTQLPISVSEYLVQPVLGYCSSPKSAIRTDVREVKSLVKLQLAELLSEDIVERGKIKVTESYELQSPWFNVEGHRVWGATAMILSELKQLIKTIS